MCHHTYQFRRECGAFVCIHCEDHRHLARCYCGWPDGQGREDLEADGEVIEDPDDD